VLRRAPSELLTACDDQPRMLRNLQAYEGSPYAMLEGAEGDILFQYSHYASFHLSADYRLLRCAIPGQDDTSWQRVLLDTILWGISLLRGTELLHCSAVVHNNRLIAFAAHMGGGKSSLAAEYIRRGATLFSDDRMALDDCAGGIMAYPGPPLMNLPQTIEPDALDTCTVLADLGEERWIEFAPADVGPMVPAAIVLIDRFAKAGADCAPIDATSLDLLAHATLLPRMRDRGRRRFELFATLAQSATVLHLEADLSIPVGDLADAVDRELM